MTTDHALIEAIRQVAQIPTERRYWSVATIAAFLEYSGNYTANEIVNRPDFPRPAKIGGNGKPRWKAGDVMAWADSWLPSLASSQDPTRSPGSTP